jgi:hypothetical protein
MVNPQIKANSTVELMQFLYFSIHVFMFSKPIRSKVSCQSHVVGVTENYIGSCEA